MSTSDTRPPSEQPAAAARGVDRIGSALASSSTFVLTTRGPDHRLTFASPLADELLTAGLPLERPLAEGLASPGVEPFLACFETVYRTGKALATHDVPLAVTSPSGALRLTHLRAAFRAILGEQGAVEGVTCFALDVSDHVRARIDEQIIRERAERAVALLSRFQGVTASLAGALVEDDVADVILSEAMSALGADTATLHVERKGVLELVRERGTAPEVADRVRQIAVDSLVPAATVFRSGEPLWVETYVDFVHQAPQVAAVASTGARARAFCCLPLRVGANNLGIIGFGFFAERRFDDSERALVMTLARQCAQSLERARLYDQQRLASARLRMLAEADVFLASSLDYETTLKNVASVLVPSYADWCIVDVLEEGEDIPRTAGFAHKDPAKANLGYDLRSKYPPARNDRRGFMSVLRSGEAELYPNMPDELLAAQCVDHTHFEMVMLLGMRSAVSVPLKNRGRTEGVLTIVSASETRAFDLADLRFAEDLAARAGLALANARLHREAQEAIRVRDEFLSIASHELNTPLTSLRLIIESLRRGRGAPSATASRLESAEGQVLRITNLVRDLLDVSHIVAGRLPINPEEVDLVAVAREVVARFQHAADAERITLHAAGPVIGLWDPSRIDQVVSNLVGNAMKYGEAKPVDIQVTRQGDWARLVVRDRGMGIAEEHQARIFERFERAVSNRHFGGFGLGLWITREAVEASGGTVRVESAPREGSTFTVDLPVTPPPPRSVRS